MSDPKAVRWVASPGWSREGGCVQHDRAGGSRNRPQGASGSERPRNGGSPPARDSGSRGRGLRRCALLGCGELASVLVEHPQRGPLLVCPHHAQRVEEIGGEVRRRYRTLPYASAVVQTPRDGGYSVSLGGGV